LFDVSELRSPEYEAADFASDWAWARPIPSADPISNLAAVNKDLATARERLTYYEAQLGKQN